MQIVREHLYSFSGDKNLVPLYLRWSEMKKSRNILSKILYFLSLEGYWIKILLFKDCWKDLLTSKRRNIWKKKKKKKKLVSQFCYEQKTNKKTNKQTNKQKKQTGNVLEKIVASSIMPKVYFGCF